MTITTTKLTSVAAVAAVVGGLLYVGVQIAHPDVNLAVATTTEWKIRESVKVLFASLSLVGITGMYLRQVKKTGVLGLLGYVVLSAGFLAMMILEVIGGVVLPSIAHSSPGFVADVLAKANGGHPTGDIGAMNVLIMAMAFGYLGGGVLFGIALFRANVLARWAAALLAVGCASTATIPLFPQVNQRLFAIPVGVAMVGLGVSLWREQRTPAARTVPSTVSAQLNPAGAK